MLEERLAWLGLGGGSVTTSDTARLSAPEFMDGPFMRLKREWQMAVMQEQLDEILARRAARRGIAPMAGTAATVLFVFAIWPRLLLPQLVLDPLPVGRRLRSGDRTRKR